MNKQFALNQKKIKNYHSKGENNTMTETNIYTENTMKTQPCNELQKQVSNILEPMCEELNLQKPDISVEDKIPYTDIKKGKIIYIPAMTYLKELIPGLSNNQIVVAKEYDLLRLTGIIAHEVRHIWQSENRTLMCHNPIYSIGQTLNDPAETDADAYAVYFLMIHYGISFENAAKVVFPHIDPHTEEYANRRRTVLDISEE